jgi:hypothetical protein
MNCPLCNEELLEWSDGLSECNTPKCLLQNAVLRDDAWRKLRPVIKARKVWSAIPGATHGLKSVTLSELEDALGHAGYEVDVTP